MPLTSFLARWARPFAAAGLFAALPVTAAPVDTHARYVVSLAGVNVASVGIDFRDDGQNYKVDIGANVSGIGSMVASGTAEAVSAGRSTPDRLDASGFEVETRTREKSFHVTVDYAGNEATGFKVTPPLIDNVSRVAIERKHLKGVTDPIGSFILKGDALAPELCNRRLKVFTGIERYDIEMSFAATQTATSTRTGYQGPVVLCRLRYIPVAGHFTTSEMTTYLENSDRILIWYAPLGDSGYFIPYRVLLGTAAGDLSMVLTALS